MTSAAPLVLRGSGESVLRFERGRITLRRADKEHHIPLAAVALVHPEGRSVAIVVTAPEDGEPTVYRVTDVCEAAALTFADTVNAALPETPAPDGAALVTTSAVTAEAPPRARTRPSAGIVLAGVAFLLVVAVLAVALVTG